MKYIRKLARLKLVALLILLIGAPLAVHAEGTVLAFVQPDVLIVEVMPDRNPNAKSDEFIELYNASNKVVPGGTLTLQTFATTATSWSATPSHSILVSQDMYPGRHYLLASSSYSDLADTANEIFPGGSLSATAGHIRLITTDSKEVSDYIEWGDVTKYASLQSGNPLLPILGYPSGSSQSYKRKVTEDGSFVDSRKSASDFLTSSSPSPQADNVLPEGYVLSNQMQGQSGGGTVTPTAGTGGEGTPSPTPSSLPNAGLAALFITELLPNPASPLSDDNDEFIELYNPNNQSFNLKGYTLESGTGVEHDYTFGQDTIIAPDSYAVYYSKQTHLSLSNSGSQVRLLDSQHNKVSETAAYGLAPEGQAWALDDTRWSWTTVPTPGGSNTINEVSSTPASKTSVVKTIAGPKALKSKEPKVTSGGKSLVAKTKKSKATKATKVAATSHVGPTSSQPQATPIHTTVLVAVGVLAVLYGAYEYRHDMANRIHRFRANRAARRTARQQAEGQ